MTFTCSLQWGEFPCLFSVELQIIETTCGLLKVLFKMNTNKRKDIEEITFVKQVVLEEISPKRAKTHASKIYDELAKRKCEELLSWMRDGKLIYLKSTDSIYNALHVCIPLLAVPLPSINLHTVTQRQQDLRCTSSIRKRQTLHWICWYGTSPCILQSLIPSKVDLVTAAVDVCEACGTFDKPVLTAGQDEELDVGDFEEQMIMNALSTTSVVGNTFVQFTTWFFLQFTLVCQSDIKLILNTTDCSIFLQYI